MQYCFSLKNEKKVSMYEKFLYECQLFSRVNFPRTAMLNFNDITWLPLLIRINVLLYTAMEQPRYAIKIQNGGTSLPTTWEEQSQCPI